MNLINKSLKIIVILKKELYLSDILNANNLHFVVLFQVFLSNNNNFQALI